MAIVDEPLRKVNADLRVHPGDILILGSRRSAKIGGRQAMHALPNLGFIISEKSIL